MIWFVALGAVLLVTGTLAYNHYNANRWRSEPGVLLQYDLVNPKIDMKDELAAVSQRLESLPEKKIQRVSATRLSIWIPYPQALQDAQAKRDAALEEFEKTQFTPSKLDSLLRQSEPGRTAQINHIAPNGTVLHQPLLDLAAAYDSQQRQKLAATAASGPATQAAVRIANDTYESALSNVLEQALDDGHLRDVLRAADDPANVAAQSHRDELLILYPSQATEILRAIETHKAWRAAGGGSVIGPEDIDRLLVPGLLDFRIAVQVNGEDYRRALESLHLHGPSIPVSTAIGKVKWCEIATAFASNFTAQDLTTAPWHGTTYVLCSDEHADTLTHVDPQRGPWRVSVQNPRDEGGEVGVAMPFELDSAGASMMQELTQSHVQQRLVILADNQALTAPKILDPLGARGIVTFGHSGSSREVLQHAQVIYQLLHQDPLPSPLRRVPPIQ